MKIIQKNWKILRAKNPPYFRTDLPHGVVDTTCKLERALTWGNGESHRNRKPVSCNIGGRKLQPLDISNVKKITTIWHNQLSHFCAHVSPNNCGGACLKKRSCVNQRRAIIKSVLCLNIARLIFYMWIVNKQNSR